jgi:hypothetical protein
MEHAPGCEPTMSNIIDAKRVRLERERKWDELEIERLQRLTRIGALDAADSDRRICELQDRVAGLTAQLEDRLPP